MTPADAWTGADTIIDGAACPKCGRETCDGCEPEAEAQPARRWQHADEALSAAPPEAVVGGAAYADCLSVMVAESGGGKTFTMLDLAAAVSADVRWHGREVRHGSAIYIGYEGHVGLRLRALREVAGHRLKHVYVIQASDPLSPIIDRDRVELPSRGETDVARDLDEIVAHVTAAELPAVRLVEADTIRASLAGSENSSDDTAAYLRAVRRLMAHTPGAAWLLAHHAGWQDGENHRKRERGSSAFRGNVDCTLYLEAGEYDRDRGEAPLTLTTLKVRDGETWPPLHLIRRRVEIPGLFDRWGQPVTSCLIESDRRSRDDRETEQAEAAEVEHRAIDLRVLRAMRDFPAATNMRLLRAHLGIGQPAVDAAVARIFGARWAAPGRRGQAYQILPAGVLVLEERTTPNNTEQHSGATPNNDTRHHTLSGVGVRVASGGVGDGDTTPALFERVPHA